MASENVLTLTETNFEAEVLKSSTPVLVDFWAPWCGPCKQIAPFVAELAAEYAGRLRVGKLDVDTSPRTATDYSISSIPVLLLFHNGQVVGSLHGGGKKARIESFIKDTLAKLPQPTRS